MRTLAAAGLLALTAPLLTATDAARAEAPAPRESAAKRAPALQINTFASGLNHPWDAKPIGGGRVLITERDPARLTVATSSGKRNVQFNNRVWTSGETGLMGLEVDPRYSKNRRFYTCSGWRKSGGGTDVRVIAWKMNPAATKAKQSKTLVSGIPTTSGRHGGCRLLITSGGAMIVGTGDAAVGTNPRNLNSLGGKTLKLNRWSGKPHSRNPFAKSKKRNKRYVLTYGHRNVQGLAERNNGTLWSIEHGSFRADEVNKLTRGGDYGWHPVPGYNESVPMTDHSLPGQQQSARWNSGSTTVATGGGTFVYGKGWGSLNGTLAVAVLKDQRVIFMRFNKSNRLVGTQVPAALQSFGRLRTVTRLSDGSLLICTDDDGDRGQVLHVRPA